MDSTSSQTKTSTNMKPRYQPHGDGGRGSSDAIRTDIAHTREQMDRTLDEIGERVTPRHLLDEVLDFFRSHRPDREKVKERAGAAASKAGDLASEVSHAVTDVIRRHPLPTLLIGAGIAWAVYERQRDRGNRGYYAGEQEFGMGGYEEFETSEFEEMETSTGAIASVKEKAAEAKGKLAEGMESAKEKGREIRERAAGAGRAARDKASQLKQGAQRKFAETSEAHPLTTGLGFLALGVLAGLAVPTSRKEDEWMGEWSDRVKGRAKSKGQELIERGKHVASAAVSAARQEAAEQGFTPEAIKEKAQSVAAEAKDAAHGAAQREGFTSDTSGQFQPAGAPTERRVNQPPQQG